MVLTDMDVWLVSCRTSSRRNICDSSSQIHANVKHCNLEKEKLTPSVCEPVLQPKSFVHQTYEQAPFSPETVSADSWAIQVRLSRALKDAKYFMFFIDIDLISNIFKNLLDGSWGFIRRPPFSKAFKIVDLQNCESDKKKSFQKRQGCSCFLLGILVSPKIQINWFWNSGTHPKVAIS